MTDSILQEIRNIKSTHKELKEFGIVMGIALAVLGGIALWRGRPSSPYLLSASGIFLVIAFAVPAILLPLQKAWMALAAVLGFFMSRVVLFIIFYGMITPLGFIARVFGKDLLDERISKGAASYWHGREGAKDKSSYENQY